MNQFLRKLLVILLLVSMLSACKSEQEIETRETDLEQITEEAVKDSSGESKNKNEMGRYVENAISLPEIFNTGQGQEIPLYIPVLKKAKGEILLFTGKGRLATGSNVNYLYRLEADNTFTEVTPQWMVPGETEEYMLDVEPMDNGDWYFLSARKLEGTADSFQYSVKKYNEKTKEIEKIVEGISMKAQYLSVGSDSTIVVSNDNAALVYQKNMDTYMCIVSGLSVDYGGVFVDDNGNIISKPQNENGPWGYWSYNGKNGEQISQITIEGMFQFSWQQQSSFHKEDGIYYICNPNGIYSKNENSENWRMVVEGRVGKWISSKNIEIFDFQTGYNDDFYALMRNQSSTSDKMSSIMLCQYYFDEEQKLLPTRFFSITSLWENEYIRKAIDAFQLSHPELIIEYNILSNTINFDQAMEDLSSVLSKQEGPDILILDGLPEEFYGNAEYFLDLTQTIEPQMKGMKKGDYYYPVITSLENEEGLYCVVTRFNPIFVMTQEKIINNTGSLKEIVKVARDNPQEYILVPEFFKDRGEKKYVLLNYLYTYYGKELLNQEGGLDKTELKEWAENANVLYQQINQAESLEEDMYLFGTERQVLEMLKNQRGKLVMMPYNEAMPPIAAQGLHFEGYETKYSGKYVQGTIAAIPSGTQNQEEASEFVRYLLSAGFQNYVPFGEWLPVYKQSVKLDTARYLKEWETWGEYHYIPEFGKDYPVYTMSQTEIDWFRWELEGYELSVPAAAITDYNREQTIPDETLRKLQKVLPSYFEGEISIEEAVEQIMDLP